ncbi:hypothetical protein RIF29_11932 [Crotalaria pallida]|uniref:RING-type E3 ubiquitin transferase n=1 Tax=Crotalaria pallida TaxID=3830 RepID=A0AAN9IMM6_CROPI
MSIYSNSSPAPQTTFTLFNLRFNLYHTLPLLLLLLLILVQFPPPAAAQLPNALTPPPPDSTIGRLKFDKSMAIVLVILVIVFLVLGFFSVYTRQCTERRLRGRFDLSIPIVSNRRPRGLDAAIIETFPTFVYSTVKGLKIGRASLECAVCLNEFEDDETLRLIPNCSHVFHTECIDAWLVNHSTCPVCRANLVPTFDDVGEFIPFVSIQVPDQTDPEPNPIEVQENNVSNNGREADQVMIKESPKLNHNSTSNRNRSPRSWSTGFKVTSLFPRSHSTGHSLVQRGENLERFTLRLPDEVRYQLVTSSLSRAKSLGVALTPERSERRGFRTGSVGSSRGRNYVERFGRSDRRGFNWMSWAGSKGSMSRKEESSKAPVAKDEVGERSSDRLFARSQD